MSAHTPSSQPVENQQSSLSLSQSFLPWVRHQSWSLTVQISAAVGLLFYLAEIAYYGPYLGKNSEPFFAYKTFPVVIDALHIVIISVFIVMTIWLRDDNKKGSESIKFIYHRIFPNNTTSASNGAKPEEIIQEKTSGETIVKTQAQRALDEAAEKEKEKEKEKDEDERRLKVSYKRLKRFKRNFLWFWIGMLSLYIVLGCSHALSMSEKKTTVDGAPAEEKTKKDTINVIVNIWDEKFEHTKKLEDEQALKDDSQPLNSWTMIAKKIVFPALSFLVNTLTMIPIFSCFLIMYFVSFKDKDGGPENNKSSASVEGEKQASDEHKINVARKYFIWGVAAFCVVYILLLCYLGPSFLYHKTDPEVSDPGQNFNAIFFALSGIINALVLALLITRLDSKLLGLRSWLICILYFYAAIQPLFAVFEFDSDVMPRITTAVILFAFILKVYFFLILMYAVQTGKMLNYFYGFPLLGKLSAYSGKLSGRVRLTSIIGLSAVIILVAMWLFPLCVSLLRFWGFTVQPMSEFAGRTWSGLVSIANIIVIAIMAIRLYMDGMDYRSIAKGLPKEPDSKIPETFTGLGANTVVTEAKNVFGIEGVSVRILRNSIEQICRFNRTFIFFWLLTVLLHLILAITNLPAVLRRYWLVEDQAIVFLILASLNFGFAVSNILVLFRCFLLLESPPTAKDYDKEPAETTEPSPKTTLWSRFVNGFRRLLLLDTLPVDGGDEKHAPSKLKQSLGYSNLAAVLFVGLVIFVFIVINAHNWELKDQKGFITLLAGITGTVSGLAIALVVARMCSRWFGLDGLTTCLLLLYAAIQPLSVFIQFAKLESMSIGVLIAALAFKIPFFLAIRASMRKGAMLNYFICLPLLRDQVNMIIENRFEITVTPVEYGKYTFSILKNGKRQFTCLTDFPTKAKCDRFIKNFTEELKKLRDRPGELSFTGETAKTEFRTGDELGAFWLEWVEKKNSKKVVLLESVTLRSEEKVEELRQEAIDMIPYCRYNR